MIKISVSFNNSPPSARQRLFILFLFLSVALAICPRGPRHRSPAGINSSTLGKSNLPVAADHVQILHVRGLGQIGQLHVTGGIWFQVSPTSGPSAWLLSWKSATFLVFLCHHSVRSVQFKHPFILYLLHFPKHSNLMWAEARKINAVIKICTSQNAYSSWYGGGAVVSRDVPLHDFTGFWFSMQRWGGFSSGTFFSVHSLKTRTWSCFSS